MHLGLHLFEARGGAALQVFYAREELEEPLALLALHLAVLHGRAPQGLVQLGGEECIRASLVLSGLRSEPEEHVVLDAALLRLVRLQDEVTVTYVKASLLPLWHIHKVEALHLPDFHASRAQTCKFGLERVAGHREFAEMRVYPMFAQRSRCCSGRCRRWLCRR